MPNLLRAAQGGMSETNSESPPASYPSGGFTVSTDLGRVDEAIVQIDNASWEARLESTDETEMVVGVYSQGSGNEAAAGTDLSDDSVSYTAARL